MTRLNILDEETVEYGCGVKQSARISFNDDQFMMYDRKKTSPPLISQNSAEKSYNIDERIVEGSTPTDESKCVCVCLGGSKRYATIWTYRSLCLRKIGGKKMKSDNFRVFRKER